MIQARLSLIEGRGFIRHHSSLIIEVPKYGLRKNDGEKVESDSTKESLGIRDRMVYSDTLVWEEEKRDTTLEKVEGGDMQVVLLTACS